MHCRSEGGVRRESTASAMKPSRTGYVEGTRGQNGCVVAQLKATWPQVLAWRMRRQLLDPVGELDAVEVVGRVCGVQAQVPTAAALAVRVRRQGASSGGVDSALSKRRLMRTWAMRGTLHLLAPNEAGAYLSLVGAARSWEKGSWQKAFGVTSEEMAELVDAVRKVLDGHVLSRDELVLAVSELLGRPDLEAEPRSGWAAVLKPVAWQARCAMPRPRATESALLDRTSGLAGWTGVPHPWEAPRS